MSFDIFFQSARFSGEPVVSRNPLTGESQTVLPSEPLSAAEVTAVLGVLERVKARGPDEFGCYVVELADGGGAEVFASNLRLGCMASVGGITPDLAQFLYDVLRAGNWVMLPAMEDAVAVTTSPDGIVNAPEDFPEVVTCDSPQTSAVLLSKGVAAWQEYRDRVVRDR